MARYVDAEKLIFEPDEKGVANGVLILGRRNGKTMRLVLTVLKQMVDGLPTEDVAPVRHGRWLTWAEKFPERKNFASCMARRVLQPMRKTRR